MGAATTEADGVMSAVTGTSRAAVTLGAGGPSDPIVLFWDVPAEDVFVYTGPLCINCPFCHASTT